MVGQNMKLSLNTVRVTVRSGQDVFLRAGAIMGCNLPSDCVSMAMAEVELYRYTLGTHIMELPCIVIILATMQGLSIEP